MSKRKHDPDIDPEDILRNMIAHALKIIRSPEFRGSSRSSPASAPNDIRSLVVYDSSKLIKKLLLKHQRSQKEILKVAESLEHYRVADAQAFETWRRVTFAVLQRETKACDDRLDAAIKELWALEDELFPEQEKTPDEPNFSNRDQSDEADDDGPNPADDIPQGPAPEAGDEFLSPAAWIVLKLGLRSIEHELRPHELRSIPLDHAEAFVEIFLFSNPPAFLKKSEIRHIQNRVTRLLRQKIEGLQNAEPPPAHSRIDLDLEIRTRYRRLAGRLHPDRVTAAELTDRHRALWHELQSAYEARDLERLRQVEVMCVFYFDDDKRGLSLTDLEKIHAKQKQELSAMRRDLRRARRNLDFDFARADAERKREAANIVRADLLRQRMKIQEELAYVNYRIDRARAEIDRRRAPAKKRGKRRK